MKSSQFVGTCLVKSVLVNWDPLSELYFTKVGRDPLSEILSSSLRGSDPLSEVHCTNKMTNYFQAEIDANSNL